MEMIFLCLYRCGLDISELCERGLAVLEKIVAGYSGDEAGHDAVKLCGQMWLRWAAR